MRSIWKGAITFGLVNVPVKLYSATEDHDIHLHQIHKRDGGRIHYERRCDVCGEIVKYEDIGRAYEESGQTVVLTDEDLESLPEGRSREIDVVEFVPDEQIDPLRFERSYFLEPDSKSIKSYVLLRRTLEETDRTAIVSFALRNKTRLGALRTRGDVLTIQGLLWDDEVREAHFPVLDEQPTVTAKELKLSANLVESMEEDFEPEQYSDEYQVQLRALLEAKLQQGNAIDTEATFGEVPQGAAGDNVVDLMEALQKSIAKSRKKQSPQPAKKTTKKAAAKKPAAKKAANEKSAKKRTRKGA